MAKPIPGLRICALAIAASASLGSNTALAAPQPRSVGALVVRGPVRVRSESKPDWHEAHKGDVLGMGTTVEALPDEPVEMQLPDGVTVRLEPGTIARWLTPGRLPSETNHYTFGYHLSLIEGELDVRMPKDKKGAHAFLVSTSAGTLTDWRGQLHILSHEASTTASIYEGALVVGSNGQGFPVYDGAGILMRKGVDPDKSRGIPTAPKWDPTGAGMASFAAAPMGERVTVGVAWQPVEGAKSYRVSIATDPAMTNVVQRATTDQSSFGVVASPDAAPAWAQVRAVGAEGIVGDWSTPRPLRVVRYKLPEGAVVAHDGTVVLPDGVSLPLEGAEGLEVAFENMRSPATRVHGIPLYWSKLTGPLRLPDSAPMRLVHLRDGSLGSDTTMVIARRQLRADIELSPKDAHEGDPVDARVMIWDPSGRVDPANQAITVETLFDITPVRVQWERIANVWTTHLQAPNTQIPSVIRVIVKDGSGIEIGRGFLEVAEAPLRTSSN